MARKTEIESIILSQKNKIKDEIGTMVRQLENMVRESVLTPMKLDEAEWTQDARALCRKWSKLYNTNQLNLLRDHGIKKGTKRNGGDVSWNSELTLLHEKQIRKYLKHLLTVLCLCITTCNKA
jgi:hypothetical protein